MAVGGRGSVGGRVARGRSLRGAVKGQTRG